MKYNFQINIEKTILEVGSLSRSQRYRLQETLETELLSIVSVNGLPPQHQQGGKIAKFPVTPNLTKEMNPTQMGQEIVRSIYGGLQ